MSVLEKVIKSQQKPTAKSISSIGTVIGIIIIIISIQLYQDVKPLISKNASTLINQQQIISKKINKLSFLQKQIKGFSKKEIEEIKAHKNVKDLAVFSSSNYQVIINVGNQENTIPGFYTLAFFESIPQRFLDESYEFQEWDSSIKEVPVVLPKNYLDAYNYGLALSMNTPQISEAILKSLRFNIEINGNGKKRRFIGRISGLSKNLNTILVPELFLSQTNKEFGENNKQNPTRVIVSSQDISDDSFNDYLILKNYSSNTNNKESSTFQKLLIALFSYQFIIALIIITQGLLLLLFYNQIIIQTSKETIKKLFIIGYDVPLITSTYEKVLFKLYLFIFSISLLLSLLIKYFLAYKIKSILNLEIYHYLSPLTYFSWMIIIISFFLFNRLNLKRKLHLILKSNHN